ncbi:hypothetical protein [Bradyrhizobium sp. SEMIA]|uniref:hypothetical protein n=1 Tax=Bradyrhizobium sp. SEMIA TaxID=2597515 RepID=UPI00223E8F45|nr:hypothetical protein [Bradyrhizobium sp. SEMIA]
MGMLDPGRFLVSCSHCDAWPMAANLKRSSWSATPHEVRFVCPRCRSEETAIVSASGELTPIKRIEVPPRDVTAAWALAHARGGGAERQADPRFADSAVRALETAATR